MLYVLPDSFLCIRNVYSLSRNRLGECSFHKDQIDGITQYADLKFSLNLAPVLYCVNQSLYSVLGMGQSGCSGCIYRLSSRSPSIPRVGEFLAFQETLPLQPKDFSHSCPCFVLQSNRLGSLLLPVHIISKLPTPPPPRGIHLSQHFVLPACVIQGLVSFVFPVTFVLLLSQIPHNSGSTRLISSNLVLLYLFLLKYIISVIFKYLE